MRILTRYLTREIIGPFFFGVTTFTAIMVGFSMIAISQRPMLDGQAVLRLTLLTIPENMAVAFPMGILLGTLFALGRLSGHSEVVAMRAGGLSGLQLVLPFIVFSILASFVSLYMAEVVVPASHSALSREMARVSGQKATEVIRRQVLPPEYGPDGKLKRLIHVGEFDLRNLYLHDVTIQEYDEGLLRAFVQADDMIWDGSTWRFQRGQIVFLDPDGPVSKLTVRGGRADYKPLLPKPKEMAAAAADPRDMTWREYRAFISKKARAGEDVRRFLVDLHTRLALPFACLALAMVGTPLGVQTRRVGTALSFGLAIAGLVGYFFLLSFAQVLGRTGIVPPVIAAWMANISLCIAGVVLFLRRLR